MTILMTAMLTFLVHLQVLTIRGIESSFIAVPLADILRIVYSCVRSILNIQYSTRSDSDLRGVS